MNHHPITIDYSFVRYQSRSPIEAATTNTATNDDALSDDCTLPFGLDVDNDVFISVLRALDISDKVCGSQKDFISILQYGRDLYLKGDSVIGARWPSSLVACMQLLKKLATLIHMLIISALIRIIHAFGPLLKVKMSFASIATKLQQSSFIAYLLQTK